MSTNNVTSDHIIIEIKNLVSQNYYKDVKNNLASKSMWKFIGDLSDAISQIMGAFAAILAFASGFFGITILAFLSGCANTISLVLRQFSAYAMKESKERTEQVNKLLDIFGIAEIPVLVDPTKPETV